MGIYIGGPGNDIINSIASAATSFGLEDDRVSTFAGDDVVYTGAGNDFIDAGDGNDILYDGDGNDTVYGGDGNDKVQVDAGNDVFYGGRDNDTLCFDVIHIGAGGGATSFQGAKIDLSLDSAQNLGEFGIDLFFGFESVLGSYGNDTLLGTNDLNVLNGQQGNDILYGRGGDDILDGDIEADTLVGGLGSDEILLGRILMSPDSSRPPGGGRGRQHLLRRQRHGARRIGHRLCLCGCGK
jgi:Ca2+-binding RTX toxin-like protein